MKRLAFLFLIAITLTACPFESPVPLDSRPAEAVDSSLLGYWYGIVRDGSDFFGIEALDLEAEGDSAYRITRYGKAIKGDIILPDTTRFTGYITHLDSARYMNVLSEQWLPADSRSKKKGPQKIQIFYLASLDLRNDTLRIQTVGEQFSARKQYKGPAELKSQLLTLLEKKANVFDDLYHMSYRRYPRPAPVTR